MSRNSFAEYMKSYAEEKFMLKILQRMLISIFDLENGTMIATLLNFFFRFELQCSLLGSLLIKYLGNASTILFSGLLTLDQIWTRINTLDSWLGR